MVRRKLVLTAGVPHLYIFKSHTAKLEGAIEELRIKYEKKAEVERAAAAAAGKLVTLLKAV